MQQSIGVNTRLHTGPAIEAAGRAHDDSRFWMDIAIFEVGGSRFKVATSPFPRSLLESVAETSKDDGVKIIRLNNIAVSDFRGFLKVAFPTLSDSPCSKDDCVGALKLAIRWRLPNARREVVARLETMQLTAVERVAIGQIGIPEWLASAYQKLAIRIVPPNMQESETIGHRVAILLFQVREQSKGIPEAKVSNIVHRVLGPKIREVREIAGTLDTFDYEELTR